MTFIFWHKNLVPVPEIFIGMVHYSTRAISADLGQMAHLITSPYPE
jgi:hypothetical protein